MAVALSTGYGLTPDPWQADVVEAALARRSSGRYSAATVGQAVPRQNGKNGWIEVRELFGMVALGEKFLHTAHEVKTARKAFRRILSFFDNERQYPELFELVVECRKTNGQEAVVLKNGGSIEFIARSSGSGRGFTVDVLVCDEAQDLTDDELAALLPTISAAPLGNPQVILTGTPPDPEKPDAAKGEVFRRVRAEAQAGTDKNLAFIDFGVPDGPLPDVDDRELWYAVNPALGGRLNIAEVVRERKLMSPAKFARERLGWWGEPGSMASVFGTGRWALCGSTTSAIVSDLTLALAVSLDRVHCSIAAAGLNADQVPHVELPNSRDMDGNPAPRLRLYQPKAVVAECKRLQDAHGGVLVVDGKGPASPLIPDLQAAGVNLRIADTEDVLNAFATLFDRVQTQAIAHLNDPELNAAVTNAKARPVGDRTTWGRRLSSADISPLEAATLASWPVEKPSAIPLVTWA